MKDKIDVDYRGIYMSLLSSQQATFYGKGNHGQTYIGLGL